MSSGERNERKKKGLLDLLAAWAPLEEGLPDIQDETARAEERNRILLDEGCVIVQDDERRSRDESKQR
ncbi:hypothetical protein [Acidimangrovimonas pyrenivorans]|uniref:Uncharacterized protein n=1 Tax=Acidimangrovimonas pyrenivorans TaxID=2030798 RepID=A0ABV7ADC1_9RHOB